MKATAAALNAKGYRTRQGARWSDTAVARALRVVGMRGWCPTRCGAVAWTCSTLVQILRLPLGDGRFTTSDRRGVRLRGPHVRGRRRPLRQVRDAAAAARRSPSDGPGAGVRRELASVEVLPGEVLDACTTTPGRGTPGAWGTATVTIGNVVGRLLAPHERQLFIDVPVSRVIVDRDSIRVVFALEAEFELGIGAIFLPGRCPLPTVPTPPGRRPRHRARTGPGDRREAPQPPKKPLARNPRPTVFGRLRSF